MASAPPRYPLPAAVVSYVSGSFAASPVGRQSGGARPSSKLRSSVPSPDRRDRAPIKTVRENLPLIGAPLRAASC